MNKKLPPDLVKRLRDPKFYLENFCKIKGKKPGLIPFVLNDAQKHLFNTLRTRNRVIILKARQIGFCLDKNTKILSNNLNWIKLKDIEIGQSIVSVAENPPGGKGRQRKMKTAIVENKWSVFEDAFEIRMEDGRELIATAQHKFLCKAPRVLGTQWKTIDSMVPGDEIRYITKPWESSDYEDGWISGMIDGEGHFRVKKTGGAELTISQVDGPVWNRLKLYLDKNNYNYRIEIDKRLPGETSKFGSKPVNKAVISRMDELFKIIGKTKPVKHIGKNWWNDRCLPNKGWSRILSIKHLGKREMIDLQTSEKTFIAEGFVSHNSTAVTGFFYHNTIMTPGTNTALIGYNSDLTAELLDKVKTFLNSTPKELRPTVHYNSKYEISFPKINSKILVLPSTDNVGRGYTLNNVLCLSGDTEILSTNGSSKKISNIEVGDVIIDGNGKRTNVVKKWKKKNNEKLIAISFCKNVSTKITSDHEVMVYDKDTKKERWKSAGSLSVNDYLAYPIFPIKKSIKELTINDVIRKDRGGNTKKVKMNVKINYDFGLFIGWYLAEGNSTRNRICISIDKSEVEHVRAIVDKMSPYISSHTTLYSKNSRTAVINIYGRNFANFIGETFGNTSKDKKIPDKVWEFGKPFCNGMVYGLFCGDGCFKDIDRVTLTNTNQSIIYQTKKIIVSLKIGLGQIRKAKAYRYGKRSRDRYDLVLTGYANIRFRKEYNLLTRKSREKNKKYKTSFIRGDKHFFQKINSLSWVEPEPFVYDIMVDSNEHSFCILANITAKNCTELAFWDKQLDKMTALEASVPPDGTIVIESTPNGQGDVFHKTWMTDDNDYAKNEYGWWWHYTEKEIDVIRRRMNNPMRFAQEYGLEFLASGRPVFDPYIIKKQRQNELHLGEEVMLDTDKGKMKYRIGSMDGLVMYRPPEEGGIYVCGADVAEGVEGGDYSVAIIWNRKTGEEVGFYRGLLPPDEFGKKLDKWGRFYNNALMVVEINNHGLTTVTILRQLIYPTMYFRPSKFETLAQTSSDKIGWKTSKVTKPLLIDDLAQMLRDEEIIVHSKKLLDEMTVYVYDLNGNPVSQEGFHDDTIMAGSIGLQGFKVMSDRPMDQLSYEKHLPHTFTY